MTNCKEGGRIVTVSEEFDFDDILDEDFNILKEPFNLDLDECLIGDDFLDLEDELLKNLSIEDPGEDLKTVEEFDPIEELLL